MSRITEPSLDEFLSRVDTLLAKLPTQQGVTADYAVPTGFHLRLDADASRPPGLLAQPEAQLQSHAARVTWRGSTQRWYFIGPRQRVEQISARVIRAVEGTREEYPLGSHSLMIALGYAAEKIPCQHGDNAWVSPERRIAWTLDPKLVDHLGHVLQGHL